MPKSPSSRQVYVLFVHLTFFCFFWPLSLWCFDVMGMVVIWLYQLLDVAPFNFQYQFYTHYMSHAMQHCDTFCWVTLLRQARRHRFAGCGTHVNGNYQLTATFAGFDQLLIICFHQSSNTYISKWLSVSSDEISETSGNVSKRALFDGLTAGVDVGAKDFRTLCCTLSWLKHQRHCSNFCLNVAN